MAAATATKGVDVKIKIGAQLVGGQRNGSLEMSAESIDTTNKGSDGWTTKLSGVKSWSSSCDGVYFINDVGIQAAQTAFKNGTEVDLEFSNGSTLVHKGKALITSMSLDAGQDDVVSYTMSFEGTGPLTDSAVLSEINE